MASNYITVDESWFLWSQKYKGRVWIGRKARKPTNVMSKLKNRKSMALVAFTCKPKKFSVSMMPKGTTIYTNSMIEYIKDTSKRLKYLKSQKIVLKDSLFQMDNARPIPHHLHSNQDYLAQRGISVVHQSPYSPDLNLCDRFLFREIKQDLKNEYFDGPKGVGGAFGKYLKTRCLIRLKSCVTTATSQLESMGTMFLKFIEILISFIILFVLFVY